MRLVLTDSDVEITPEWITGEIRKCLEEGDFEALDVYAPLGVLALGEEATVAAVLTAVKEFRLNATWTVEKLKVLGELIDNLERTYPGVAS